MNHFLDLSVVYGNTDQVGAQVREFNGGRLRAELRGGKEWLPRNNNATGICFLQDIQEPCYMAGKVKFSKTKDFLKYRK